MINGSVYDVVASMNNALVHKISNKIKPDQMKNGQEVEEQLFWTDIIGNK